MSHTPGLLRVDPKRQMRIATIDDNMTIASTGTTDSIRDNWEDNARRIVACWNACDGIDTEYLEGNDSMAHYARRLMLQRADLLKALQQLMALESRGRVMPFGKEWNAARAAIARATGEQS